MTPQALAATHAAAFSAARAWSADEFAALLAAPNAFVAGDAESFALIRVSADEAEVLTLATLPQVRRTGRATAALSSGEEQARSAGATTMFLEVAEDNAAARALYHKAGYAQVGRRPNYYLPKNGAAVAALVLCKELRQG